MSVRFHRFLGVQPELFEKGICKSMSNSDLRFYLYLCWMSDRKSSRQFKVVAREAAEWTGMCTRLITKANRNLCRLGVVRCERTADGTLVYTMCDIRTGEPYPGNPRDPILETSEAKRPRSQKTAAKFERKPHPRNWSGNTDQGSEDHEAAEGPKPGSVISRSASAVSSPTGSQAAVSTPLTPSRGSSVRMKPTDSTYGPTLDPTDDGTDTSFNFGHNGHDPVQDIWPSNDEFNPFA